MASKLPPLPLPLIQSISETYSKTTPRTRQSLNEGPYAVIFQQFETLTELQKNLESYRIAFRELLKLSKTEKIFQQINTETLLAAESVLNLKKSESDAAKGIFSIFRRMFSKKTIPAASSVPSNNIPAEASSALPSKESLVMEIYNAYLPVTQNNTACICRGNPMIARIFRRVANMISQKENDPDFNTAAYIQNNFSDRSTKSDFTNAELCKALEFLKLRKEILNTKDLRMNPPSQEMITEVLRTPGYSSFQEIAEKHPNEEIRYAATYLQIQADSSASMKNQIFPWLDLGNYHVLEENPSSIYSSLISLGDRWKGIQTNISEENKLQFEVEDDLRTKEELSWKVLERNFEKGFALIDAARDSKSRIFIHCNQGKSRSAAFVVAYIMNRYEVPFEQALNFVRNKRPIVEFTPFRTGLKLNTKGEIAKDLPSFQTHLQEYQKELGIADIK